jgi:hypothetical protein
MLDVRPPGWRVIDGGVGLVLIVDKDQTGEASVPAN